MLKEYQYLTDLAATYDVPVEDVLLIAISGLGQDADRQRSAEAGCDHHFVKPVAFAELDRLLAARKRATGMRPRRLMKLLNSLAAAAEVMEAIDRPDLQAGRDWDLTNWAYEPVPWGVRFVHHDGPGDVTSTIVAAALPEPSRDAFARAYTDAQGPTTFLFFS